jgi:hypothetical protein
MTWFTKKELTKLVLCFVCGHMALAMSLAKAFGMPGTLCRQQTLQCSCLSCFSMYTSAQQRCSCAPSVLFTGEEGSSSQFWRQDSLTLQPNHQTIAALQTPFPHNPSNTAKRKLAESGKVTAAPHTWKEEPRHREMRARIGFWWFLCLLILE